MFSEFRQVGVGQESIASDTGMLRPHAEVVM
jgi:hypothetical protein